MVDVGSKEVMQREAVAEAIVSTSAAVRERLAAGTLPKGDAFAVVRVAAIQGAKRTSDLIPLCHPLQLTKVDVDFDIDEENTRIGITATVHCRGKTGVEMEALTAVSLAALTLYDMAKAVDKAMRIDGVRLVEKTKDPL